METLTKTLYLEEETNFFFHNLRLQLSFERQFYIYLRRDEWDHRRKHGFPTANIEFDKCL